MNAEKWGYLRESRELAEKNKVDPDTGLHRTGLDEYLEVIFPETSDWIHDKALTLYDPKCRQRPDYRSESLKLIIEFDGILHYTKPTNILKDALTTKMYEGWGYKVVRIPYFIQLTNKVVETLFGVSCTEKLFNPDIPSMGIKGENTPAFLCVAGIKRMAREFRLFPEQYEVNLKALKGMNNEDLTGASLLEEEYKCLV